MTGLEKLYQQFHGRDFEVLGFPCNQFGGQEPGNCRRDREFCKVNFGVTFSVMAKVDVNGPELTAVRLDEVRGQGADGLDLDQSGTSPSS